MKRAIILSSAILFALSSCQTKEQKDDRNLIYTNDNQSVNTSADTTKAVVEDKASQPVNGSTNAVSPTKAPEKVATGTNKSSSGNNTSSTINTSKEPETNISKGEAENTATTTSNEEESKSNEKKGMSKGAQGAIIGGVTGAAAGTVIGKNAKGAAIGAAVGAAGGYLIGREKDKKDGRVKSKDDKKE